MVCSVVSVYCVVLCCLVLCWCLLLFGLFVLCLSMVVMLCGVVGRGVCCVVV